MKVKFFNCNEFELALICSCDNRETITSVAIADLFIKTMHNLVPIEVQADMLIDLIKNYWQKDYDLRLCVKVNIIIINIPLGKASNKLKLTGLSLEIEGGFYVIVYNDRTMEFLKCIVHEICHVHVDYYNSKIKETTKLIEDQVTQHENRIWRIINESLETKVLEGIHNALSGKKLS